MASYDPVRALVSQHVRPNEGFYYTYARNLVS
jgi:hypothetical protein